jgi:carboxypeptidase PM20D1
VKKLIVVLAAGLGLLAAIAIVRALALPTPEPWDGLPPAPSFDREPIGAHLAEAIRIRTISNQDGVVDAEAFESFISWLAATYPEAHRALGLERPGKYSLLYGWTGKDAELRPILLTAHYDVVPVIPGSEGDWVHPPFEGVVADGYVWGRGALDDKSAVVAMMEAVTQLLAEGFVPERTIYVSFGHDEELGGGNGAGAVTELLRSRGVELDWSLDEGSFLIEGFFPGVEKPMAMVSVAEKGYVTLDLVARGTGGHSSMPPSRTAVGELAEAIVAVQESPLPGGLDGNTAELMDALAPHVPFGFKLALANRWLFGELIESALFRMPTANAMMRTTTAPTMLAGSVKENVLPIEAVGTVNFRVHPRDTVAEVVAHVKGVVDAEEIEVRRRGVGSESSEVSSTDSDGWRHLGAAIRAVYGDVVVVPGLVVGGTDSRHYGQIARDAYRFNPMVVSGDDISGFHGTNERIALDGLHRGVGVYVELMRRSAGARPEGSDR